MGHISPAAVSVRACDRKTRLLHEGDELRNIATVCFDSSWREMPDVLKIGDILFQSLFLDVVLTCRITAGFKAAPGLLVPVNHEVSALRTLLVCRLICTYELALWIVGATIEFTPLSAMLLSCHNLAVAAWNRAFAEWDGLGVLALREA